MAVVMAVLPTHVHDTWPSCAQELCPCPLCWDKGTAEEMEHSQQQPGTEYGYSDSSSILTPPR